VAKDCGIVERVLEWIRYRQESMLTDEVRQRQVRGIAKLDEALLAGGPRAHECTLILTEGDSAKTFAVSGLAVVGRERYGVFPLKGKVLNVREATRNQVAKNEELKHVAAILGLSLKPGQQRIDPAALRYGQLMIMTDQVLRPWPTGKMMGRPLISNGRVVGDVCRITMDRTSRGLIIQFAASTSGLVFFKWMDS